MRTSDKVDRAINEWMDKFPDLCAEHGGCPVSTVLRLAYSIDPTFQYEPNGSTQFTLTFTDQLVENAITKHTCDHEISDVTDLEIEGDEDEDAA